MTDSPAGTQAATPDPGEDPAAAGSPGGASGDQGSDPGPVSAGDTTDPDQLPADEAALLDPDAEPQPNPYTDGTVSQEDGL